MPDQLESKAFAATCDHHYESRLLGGHPLTIRACTFCHIPDWADLAEQAAELYRWGWQEGRAGKAARETLSAYDKPVRPDHWAAQPPLCGASILGVSGPLGPCILRHRHDGLVHKDASGAQWWPKVEADEPEPDPLTPFRALADQYAAKAAESTRNANTAPLTIRTANQGIAAGWRSAEFLLRHTLAALDNGRATPNNTAASDDAANNLVQVGWYCWRCHAINAKACRSDCVSVHVPTEWASDMGAEIARREDEPDDEDPGGVDNPVASAVDENAAVHFILTTICERNGYRPPPPGVQITTDDLAAIDRMVEYGTPFGEAVSDVIGLAAWQAQQADAVLDQRIDDARNGPEAN